MPKVTLNGETFDLAAEKYLDTFTVIRLSKKATEEILKLRIRLAQADLAPEYCIHCGGDIGSPSIGAGTGHGQQFQCEECALKTIENWVATNTPSPKPFEAETDPNKCCGRRYARGIDETCSDCPDSRRR